MKKLLILGAGEMQIPVIQKAVELGIYTLVVDMAADAPGLKYASEYALISTIDKDAVLSYAKEKEINGIITTSDYPVNVVAFVGAQMGIPAMSEDVAQICTNKFLQRKKFSENGINVPFYGLCDKSTNLTAYNKFPYIVKPVDSSASRGVMKVNNPWELQKAVNEALVYSYSGKVIIESFIGGREFSVETLTQNQTTHVINITEKLIIGEEEGFFVEDTHIEPARILEPEAEAIRCEVVKAIDATGMNNCPSHTEIKLYEGKAYIIEIACRLGGDYITSDLVPLSTGVDMLKNLIKIALDEPIEVGKLINKYSLVQFINNENYEHCLHFIEQYKSSIFRSEVKPKHGNVIKSSHDRMGYIILQMENEDEVARVLSQIKH